VEQVTTMLGVLRLIGQHGGRYDPSTVKRREREGREGPNPPSVAEGSKAAERPIKEPEVAHFLRFAVLRAALPRPTGL